ncbi:Tubulinyl-Tyr carboxypeptidase 2 [Thoreauomyces humboldtii]|nr:Tubulinyl-Tyr carboxypeptidase 2 [Thoreauomyces humboldtii]
MVNYALPIKCLEAVVLAAHLTSPMAEIQRIQSGADTYRHIVLLIRHGDRWGALGLSRRPDLMNKPLSYKTLPDILNDYKAAYERNGHSLLKIKLGLPISHDASSNERITWKYLSLKVTAWMIEDSENQIEKYTRGLRGGFKPSL